MTTYEDDAYYAGDDDDDEESKLTQDDMWGLVTLYFKSHGLVSQQLKSFDKCIDQNIDDIIADKGAITLHSRELISNREANEDVDEDDDEENSEKTISIQFSETSLQKPNQDGHQLTPMDARLRSLTYGISLLSTITVNVADNNDFRQMDSDAEVKFADVPLMVRSKYCHLHDSNDNLGECEHDPGGYFIVNGSEKVIIGQEHMVINKPICFAQKSMVKYDLASEIRSQPPEFGRLSQPFDIYLCAPTSKAPRRVIHTKLSKTEKTIPLFILFRALNVVSDKEILDHICYDPEDSEFLDVLRPSIEEASSFTDSGASLDFIAKRCSVAGEDRDSRKKKAKHLLDNYLLPHLGETGNEMSKKAYFIGYMAHNLIETSLGRREQDDRDHYSNKRLDLAGPLIGNLFALLFEKMIKSLTAYLVKKTKDKTDLESLCANVLSSTVSGVKQTKSITSGLEYSIGTGNWSVQRQAGVKAGVSQMLNRLTYISTLSNLRRTNTPIGRDGKLTGPRHLHNTHWGYICPVETPEGQSCGLIKNLALMTMVTVKHDIGEKITGILEETGAIPIEKINPDQIQSSTKIFINGAWFGIHDNASEIMNRLRRARRNRTIKSDISFVHNIADREIFIWSDAGRVTRPLLIVEDMKIKLKHQNIQNLLASNWKSALSLGYIEYLDIDEEETRLIAMTPDELSKNEKDVDGIKTYTHCEIHPSLILGVCGSIIPFPDHNQSPRNTYQCAMGKQAIGLYATNFMARMDSSAHVLWYPQKPLVTTRSMNYLNFKSLPAGINVCIAVNCYTGYNQEDSLMLNYSSIDRGLFRSFFFRTYKESAVKSEKDPDQNERFTRPLQESVKGIRHGDASNIGDDGLAIPGKFVTAGDLIIGKVSPDAPTEVDTRALKDTSICVRPMESGIVDLVLRTTTRGKCQLARVRTRQMRRPEIGDKFSSRHGQKGVCGMTYRQEDMPFTRSGMVPDIIMNPHALPSRMTIGQLIENLLGKATAICPEHGSEGDATPFTNVTVKQIAESLQSYGFEKYGNETFYNGRSGKRLKAKIYYGPTYYQRLKHMVCDKAHARAHGKKTLLLRQPVEGRSRNGGLRFGEMERDCLIAHGVSAMLRDRLLENSDRYFVTVCKTCGLIAIEKPDGSMECPGCQDNGRLARVEMPYAFKLVLQELMSMCIAPRLNLVED
jgi:DNA-directed RNA polymerase II subunit RPB2